MSTQSLEENYVSLLNFIKAFESLKGKQSLRVEECSPLFYAEEIPLFEDYVWVHDALRPAEETVEEETEKSGQDILLWVKSPERDPAPKVPNILKTWIVGDPERFDSTLSVWESLDDESFQTKPERVQAFEQWIRKWDEWAKKQQEKEKVHNFFSRLRDIRTSLELYGETLEFILGNGILQQRGNSLVHYPLLVKRLLIDFDPKANVISIRMAEYDTELEQDIFPKLHGIYGQGVSEIDFRDDLPFTTPGVTEKIETMLHRIAKNSRLVTYKETLKPYDDILVCMTPVFFLRNRPRKVGRMVEQLKNGLHEGSVSINPFIRSLLQPQGKYSGNHSTDTPEENRPIAEKLARSCGESREILLAKPANQQQLEIAEKMTEQDIVVVQGPPGTGKTHTIANLLGHFLSEGKRILVTSEQGKALKVLKGQMIAPLQDLCVSVTGETSDTIASVQGIMKYISQHSETELKRKIQNFSAKRRDCIAELNRTREAVFAQRNQQYEVKAYEGQGYSVLDMADFLRTHEKELNYIPGKIQPSAVFPLTEKELMAVYDSNGLISSEDERDMKDLPDLGELRTPEEVAGLLARRKAADDTLHQIQCDLQYDAQQESLYTSKGQLILQVRSEDLLLQLEKEVQEFNRSGQFQEWMLQCIMDCLKGGAYKTGWTKFTQEIQEIVQFFDQHCVEASRHFISAEESLKQRPNALSMLLECADEVQADGSLSFLFRISHRKHKEVLQSVKIDGHPPKSKEDVLLIWNWLSFLEQLQRLAPFWERLSGMDETVPDFQALKTGGPAEMIAMLKQFTVFSAACVDSAESYGLLLQHAEEAGFVVPQKETIWTSDMEVLKRRIQFLQEAVPQCITGWKQFHEKAAVEAALSDLLLCIQRIPSRITAMKVFQDTVNQLQCVNDDTAMQRYETTYRKIQQLYARQKVLTERNRVLSLLRQAAPGWALAIEMRSGDFGKNIPQDSIRDAWKWKVFEAWIQEINAAPMDEMQKKAEELAEQLRTYTGKLCEYKAWLNVAEQIHSDGNLRMALQIWQTNIKWLGKGTGKSADGYRRNARNAMAKCQDAVPVWIMPFASALDMFDPMKNHFDILIVDEASQSDLTSLAVLGMADKVIVVGDDKQVSPSNIGIKDDEINRLKEQCLPTDFPLSSLLTAQTSLYDLAAGSGNHIELIEHFRCVPDIIGYSNNLAYGHAIKPLRPASDTNLHPAVIPFRVPNGKRHGKINPEEARMIAALIKACCQNAAYEGKTMGVISLLSGGQAGMIAKEISAALPLKEIEERRILCGEAAQFQGDERDVIFLSMVDSPDTSGPLTYRSPAQSVYQQRYNVAVSRAKDQLWIVHSLDKNNDLKSGADGYDIRRGLLEYAKNPSAYNDEQKIEQFAESPFEKEVCRYLQQEGFHFEQQWKAGAYRIDIVVLYGDDRVAIECDGMRFHGTAEKIQEDMERQTILERLGWRFIRIRGTEFYRDKEGTMRRVYQRLAELGIQRESVSSNSSEQEPALIQSIETMATRILAGDRITGEVSASAAESLTGDNRGKKESSQRQKEKEKENDDLVNRNTPSPRKTKIAEVFEETKPALETSSLFPAYSKKEPSLFSIYSTASAKGQNRSTQNMAAETVDTYGVSRKKQTIRVTKPSPRSAEPRQPKATGQSHNRSVPEQEIKKTSAEEDERFIKTVEVGSHYKLKVAKDSSQSVIVDEKNGKYYECKPGLRLVKYFMELGTITQIQGGKLTLKFAKGEKTFHFPEDIQSGMLFFRIMDNKALAKDWPIKN